MFRKYSTLLLLALYANADGFYAASNFQGFTGLINTPSAEVIDDGKVELQYSNQVDAYRVRKHRDDFKANNYFVTIGLLPNTEIVGRLANIEDKGPSNRAFLDRDLSGSVKYQIPLYHAYLPKIAVGIQDVSGTADRYNAKYIVATETYAFLRGSVGYGFSSKHLDGVFGGLEVKATDWMTLIGEYDTMDTRVGFRLNTPKPLLDRFDLSLTGNYNTTDDKERFSFAVNLRMNLGDDHDNIESLPHTPPLDLSTATEVKEVASPICPTSISSDLFKTKIEAFKNDLISFGFENVDIGLRGERFYVAYENNVLDHNELDAIGVILGYMVREDLPFEKFELVMKKSNLKVRSIKGSLFLYKAFIKNISQKSLRDFRHSLTMKTVKDGGEKLYVENANSSYFKTRVELAPGLTTFVGTEVGLFEYLVSFRPYVHWNLYKGLDLGVLSDFPLFHSSQLDRDTGAFGIYNEGNQLLSVMLHKSDVIGNFINVASVGSYKDYLGGFDNLRYIQNNHTLGLKVGYLEDDSQQIDIRRVYLASYSYYYDKLDTTLTVTGGRYYNQDDGFDIKFKRFVGDTAITVFYQNTSSEYVGLGIELPLTPRRVPDGYLQLKGKKDFTYELRSSIRDASGENTIKPSGAVNPRLAFDVEDRFANRNRLSEDYLLQHVLRLRDAYFQYVMK